MPPLRRGRVLLHVHGRADREQLNRRADHEQQDVIGPCRRHDRRRCLGSAEQDRPARELPQVRVPAPP